MCADLTAIAVGALQGAIFAGRMKERRIDLLGVIIVGTWTGLGGSLIRDAFLAEISSALRSNWYLLTAVVAAVSGMLLYAFLGRLDRVVTVLDALTVGLYAAIGTSKALQFELPTIPALFVGSAAAVGGSVLRDVFLGVPVALAQIGSLYGVAAIVGAATLASAVGLGASTAVAATICVVVTMTVRLCAVRFAWTLPEQRALGRRAGPPP